MKREHLVVLFSGGVDSTIGLAWARRRASRVTTLEIQSADRPTPERKAADRITTRLRPDRRVMVQLAFPLEVPRSGRPGYLAARNLLLHAIAQSLAETTGAHAVVAGHLAEDGSEFPDAKPAYLRSIERLASAARPNRGRIRILTPLAALDVRGRARLAQRLDAPLHLAWSCWRSGPKPCGRCAKCRERKRLDAALNGSR